MEIKLLSGALGAEITGIDIKDTSDQGKKIFVMDAALVIEAGMTDMYDHIMLIQADEHIRIDRASKRSGLSDKEIRKRIQLQMSENEKEKFASVLIWKNQTLLSI